MEEKGQVLKIDGQIAWADETDTIYTPHTFSLQKLIRTRIIDLLVIDKCVIGTISLMRRGLREILKDHQPDLKNLIGKADGIAALDWLGKVPRQQLPRELTWKRI